jgi:thioredoxin 2
MSADRTAVEVCDACGTKNRVPAAATGAVRCGKCHGALPQIIDASDDDFDAIATRAPIPVLVDLWAEWCGPCRMVSPVLEQIAHQLAGRLKLVKVDVDRSPVVARRFGAQAIPLLVLLRDGKVVSQRTGAAPERVLREWIDSEIAAPT